MVAFTVAALLYLIPQRNPPRNMREPPEPESQGPFDEFIARVPQGVDHNYFRYHLAMFEETLDMDDLERALEYIEKAGADASLIKEIRSMGEWVAS